MDYPTLAAELVSGMQVLQKVAPQKYINESFRGEAFVLHFIASHPGVLPNEISSEMGVSSARIAVALNNLEGKGLITRQINPRNRRQILVGITQEGKALTEKQHTAVIAGASKMLALLGKQDAKEYVRITIKLAEIMSTDHASNQQ